MSGVLIVDDWLVQISRPSIFMPGFITSIYELGCLVGFLASFAFSERFGRKKPLLIGTTLVIVGAVLQTVAYERIQFMV